MKIYFVSQKIIFGSFYINLFYGKKNSFMNSMFYFRTITPLLSPENYCAGAGIDLSSLSIVDGKVCWDLYIDGLVVSSDGNLLDALGAAFKVYASL